MTGAAVESALSVKNVSVSYGPKQPPVFQHLSLDVAAGETFGLMGLNGVGKTTLIKSILGLRDHSEGEIFVYGQSNLLPKAKFSLAYLPERFDPPWFLRGLEFIKFSMSLYKAPFDKAKVLEASESLALNPDVLKNKVQTYSKGMRQKLGLLATLLTGCPLLILDEPMSGLDPMARAFVKEALRRARAAGRTVFLSSHILSDMNEICDRVCVLSQGELKFTGTPTALLTAGGSENIERAFLNIIGVPVQKTAA